MLTMTPWGVPPRVVGDIGGAGGWGDGNSTLATQRGRN